MPATKLVAFRRSRTRLLRETCGLAMSKKKRRLNIDRIIESLSEVQQDFSLINQSLTMRREYPNDELIQNMVSAYYYLDRLVADEVELLPAGVDHILELNHIVLCGTDPVKRMEYGHHLMETEKKFHALIRPIIRWYLKHQDSSAYKVASQLYVGVLSQPQLFIEGNHRTGALLASYYLLMGGKDPFVLNLRNAVAYFEPSSQIKFSDKRTIKGRLKLPKYEKDFKKFLESNVKLTKGLYVLKAE